MRRNTRQKAPEPEKSFYLKYPTPTLAIVSLLSIVFTLGMTWATANARIARLEEITSNSVSKEEINTIKALIQGLSERIDILLKRSIPL